MKRNEIARKVERLYFRHKVDELIAAGKLPPLPIEMPKDHPNG